MDMLEVGVGNMTQLEEQTHFSFWAALKSPLIIGADVTKISKQSLDILLNKEIIAISQDDAGAAVSYIPELSKEGSFQVWAGPFSSGKAEFVILVLNEGSSPTNIEIPLAGIQKLSNSERSRFKVRDVWAATNMGIVETGVSLKNISSHQTKVLVLSRA